VRATSSSQPIQEGKQVSGHGSEGTDFFLALTLSIQGDRTSHNSLVCYSEYIFRFV
jgi:hypothetical protein